jgi:hypoxanthine-guanine phosphoribosyltransferase
MSSGKDKDTISTKDILSQDDQSDTISTGEDLSKIIEWVYQLKETNMRVNSLVQLSKKREGFPDLAIYLWYTPGVISIL